jgi:hypothetical protein
MYVRKTAKLLLVFILFLFLFPAQAEALEDARVVTEFISEYSVTSENTGEAEINISFTNEGEVSTILSQYNLNIGNVDPSNVQVSYLADDISFTLYESNGLVLQMSLGDIILSPDEPEVVTIKYDLSHFFSEVGGSYDITLPVFDSSSRSLGGTLSITYPNSFGSVNYSSIEYTKDEGETSAVYTFQSEDTDSVFLSVGSKRYFSMNMERKLENTSSEYLTQQLLIPIDTSTQTLIISNISPFPSSVNMTDEGNLFLVYNIAPQDTIWVRFQALIATQVLEDTNIQLSTAEKSVHLDDSLALWKIRDDDIINTVGDLGEMTRDEKVDWIYSYVMDNLNLSDDFRELHSFEYRKGAEIALQTYKNASSEDFADVFVALARLMDIPSRVVSGYVYPYAQTTNRVGIYHVWPQYWSDDEEWVSMDPAYELYSGYDQQHGTGLNRVIVAVYPSSLSDLDFEESSSEIFFTEESVEEIVDLDIEIEISDQIQAGKAESGTLTLYNNGNTIIRGISFSDISGDLDINFDSESDRSVLLPGESFDYDFSVRISEWYLSGNKTLNVEVLSQTAAGQSRDSAEKTVGVTPLKWAEPVTWIITTLLFVFVTGFLYLIYKLVLRLGSNIKK